MKLKFIDKIIDYDGSQLRSHFIFENFGIVGDSIISFVGSCNVCDHMVDLADKKNKEFIFSKSMLHFLVEHFDRDIEKAILKKRMLVSIINEEISFQKKTALIERRGNGLYFKNKKLNVAVATSSGVSTLIHVGLNIDSSNTPVPSISLEDLKIKPKDFALKIMKRYVDEMESIKISSVKVKPVL